VDPTTQAFVAALIGALVAGGGVLAWHVSERQQGIVAPTEEPAVPEGVASVLSVLRSSAVVVGADDTVLKASAPAYAMGLVSGTSLMSHELAELVTQVRRDGQIRETELLMARQHAVPRHVTVRVAPLTSTLVLALVEDRTKERRVETVRRDFVANVSHELKTPVGAIKLLAEAVCDAADDPVAVRRFAGRMLTESDRLSRLVQQIIELSRLQDDDPLDAPVVVSVDEVVAGAVDASAIDANARGIKIVTNGTHDLKVFGNEEQVSAAVANLVANAVAYSGDDSTVLVSTKPSSGSDEGMVEISVVDQGIGIPLGELDRIFERFYRVDPARHRSTGGTGLGLSIVKHVAATHGGEIRVWSVEGHGSTFTLTLPRANQEVLTFPVFSSSRTRRATRTRSPTCSARRGTTSPSPAPDPMRSRSSTATAPTSCCST
jgi:two-component system sensor histidine kinase SenX3